LKWYSGVSTSLWGFWLQPASKKIASAEYKKCFMTKPFWLVNLLEYRV